MQLLVMGIGLFKSLLLVVHTPGPLPPLGQPRLCRSIITMASRCNKANCCCFILLEGTVPVSVRRCARRTYARPLRILSSTNQGSLIPSSRLRTPGPELRYVVSPGEMHQPRHPGPPTGDYSGASFAHLGGVDSSGGWADEDRTGWPPSGSPQPPPHSYSVVSIGGISGFE
jgi:hypothetical protein